MQSVMRVGSVQDVCPLQIESELSSDANSTGAHYLAEALQVNRSIQGLWLKRNTISAKVYIDVLFEA
jgi:hypothetical protein